MSENGTHTSVIQSIWKMQSNRQLGHHLTLNASNEIGNVIGSMMIELEGTSTWHLMHMTFLSKL